MMLLSRGKAALFSLKTNCVSQILLQSTTVSVIKINVSDKLKKENVISSPYETIPIPRILLHHLIWQDIHKWSDKIAIECGLYGKKYTYRELRNKCKNFSKALLKSGLTSGKDVVTLVLPNMPEFPVATLGAIEAGLVVAPINPNYTSDEIAYQIKNNGSSCVITHYDHLDSVLRALEQSNMSHKIMVICIDDYDGKHRTLPSKIVHFSEMLNLFKKTSVNQSQIAVPEDIVLQPHSSGTSGLPKGVCLSHNNIVSNLLQMTHPEMDSINESTGNNQDTLPAILPFFHMFGNALIMLRGLFRGAKIVTLPKFIPSVFLDIMKSNKEIYLHAVPPVILFISSNSSVKSEHLAHLRTTLISGAPCSTENIARLKAKKKHRVHQAYGLTESGPLTHPFKENMNVSSTGPPVFGTIGKSIDWTTGETLPTGVVGELCFKGPQTMVRYTNNPSATIETVDKNGWLHTGDIGYFDSSGNCYILDRIKELIKVKGFQVAPAELEAILCQHPCISDAAVTSIPCLKNGETPVAFVVVKEHLQQPNEQEVKAFVASKVAPYKQLSHIFFVDSIPKTSSGKILRRKIREILENEI